MDIKQEDNQTAETTYDTTCIKVEDNRSPQSSTDKNGLVCSWILLIEPFWYQIVKCNEFNMYLLISIYTMNNILLPLMYSASCECTVHVYVPLWKKMLNIS